MILKLSLIFAFTFLYGGFEMMMNFRQQAKSKGTTTGDRGSLQLLYLSISVGYFLGFSAASTKFGRIYHWDALFAAGTILILVGLFVRVRSILTLNKFFTYTVTKAADHQLVTTGFYRYIRHPGYLGQLLVFLGIATALSNWLTILCMMVPILAAYLYRIGVEERFMTAQMGVQYSDYKKKTKKLIPGIF
jgi:protein-S-isoprenylcysteine O-methyltransferase Ste14